jgi:ABC-type multidrug transport system fused ATPase/permease subunit
VDYEELGRQEIFKMEHIFYFIKKLHAYSGRMLYINLFAMIFISLLDGIGILFLVPMINMTGMLNLDTAGTPILKMFEFLKYIPNKLGLPLVLGIYVMLVISQNILQRQITIRNTMIQHDFFRHLRVETYEALLHANWAFFIKKRKSDLINSLTSEIASASAGTNSFLQFTAALIFTFIQIGFAFWLSPRITIFVLVSGLILILFSRRFLQKSRELGSKNYELGKSYLAGITDQINGIKDIKSNTLEESRIGWYKSVTQGMKDEQVEFAKLNTKYQLYYKAASALLIAIFLYVAVKMFNAQPGQLTLILVIFSRLWPRVSGIQAFMGQIATKIPAYKAVADLQKECKVSKEFFASDIGNSKPIYIKKAIDCQGVHFRYNQNNSPYALQNINLTIPVNQMTAVVGRSGAGKSTLIDLLMGLNIPEKGQVLLDGKPLTKENLLSLRRAVSYVPQDPFLFNASIRENLLLVKQDAAEEDIWEALEFSSAGEFVKRLPEGLDTLIGDRGIRLSGGERQRLVLARAILRNPSILVLDEATSSLDTENESKIQEALERLKGKMTIIVIAHRLSTIRNADQVIVLDQGRIIQKGEFGQLANEKRSVFSQLLRNQMQATR